MQRVALRVSASTRPSPGKVLILLTVLPLAVPSCRSRHHPGETFSRLTLVLLRNWDSGDIERLLGEPEVQAPRQEFPRNAFPGAGDRFCLNRVTLAEVADPALNRRLIPTLQSAHALIRADVAVFLRYGVGQWLTVAQAKTAREGEEIVVASPSSGFSRRRTVASVGLEWRGLRVVTLAPTRLEARLATHPAPSP